MNSDPKEIDENLHILVLVTGALTGGDAHWAYASIPVTRYEPFKKAEKKGDYDLADYGHILEHGTGNAPPAEIVEKMKDEYGASHTFEEELNTLIKQTDMLLDKELKHYHQHNMRDTNE